jgi:hypothetical protein
MTRTRPRRLADEPDQQQRHGAGQHGDPQHRAQRSAGQQRDDGDQRAGDRAHHSVQTWCGVGSE